jgi:hypothetical protein
MVRSAAAFLAVLMLPGLALAQAPQRSHTVVDDDTLWDLAQRYFQDPWDWRTIWEANRSAIDDPNLIYPDQVLVIPGIPADRTADAGTPGDRPVPGDTPPGPVGPPAGPPGGEPQAGGPSPADRRTIFYRNQPAEPSVVDMLAEEFVAVDVDQVYSAPWLVRLDEEPAQVGSVVGFAHESDRGSTLRQFHQIRLVTDAPLRVGARLRTFRETRVVPDVGRVLTPTGVVSITALADSGAIAVVTEEYGRIQPGDLVGELPGYSIEVGQQAQPVEGGSEAMIMGFANSAVLRDIGQNVFLDLGSDDGIGVGDEFVLFSDAVATEARGRLQVVGVTPMSATARIMGMSDNVFRQGVIVRLERAMP